MERLGQINPNIIAETIKRTNDYHDIKSTDNIISATNIRTKLNNEEDEDTQFVFEGLYDSQRGYSICAYDFVSVDAKVVTVTLNISIPGQGDTRVKVVIYVRQYLYITFANNTSLQSGSAGKYIDILQSECA